MPAALAAVAAVADAGRARRAFLGLSAGALAGTLAGPSWAQGSPSPGSALWRLDTDWGPVLIRLDLARAPRSAGHFQAHLAQGLLDHGSFYRSVNPANDRNPATISVLQGGLGDADSPLGNIAHESTAQTGLRHRAGTLSLARGAPGTASCEFFVCLADCPVLDAGGARNPDGQGFAAFGEVEAGLAVLRRIAALPTRDDSDDAYTRGQMLAAPAPFRGWHRA